MTLQEAARQAMKAAYIARRDAALRPLGLQLYRAVTTHFTKQKVWLRDRLQRRTESLNDVRLNEGLADDLDPILNEMFLEFRPQFSRDLARMLKEGMNVAAKHKSADFGVQISFNLAHPGAERELLAHAAEQVTRIDETTRGRLKAILHAGQKDGLDYRQIAKEMVAQMGEFAEPATGPGVTNRAEVIVVHELGTAYETASNSAAGMLAAKGVPMTKEWSPTGDGKVCPLCRMNAAAGPIPFDSPFPSGHMHALAHVRCRCSVLHEMDEAAADRIIGPREPTEKPVPVPKATAAPAATAKTAPKAKPKKKLPQQQIKEEIAALQDQVSGRNPRLDEVEARLREIKAEKTGLLAAYTRGDTPEVTARWNRIDAEQKALADEWTGLGNTPTNPRTIINRWLRLPDADRAKVKVSLDGSLGHIQGPLIAPGELWIRQNVRFADAEKHGDRYGRDPTKHKLYAKIEVRDIAAHPDPQVRIEYARRAFNDKGRVYMPARGERRVTTFVHEFGHTMDYQSPLRGMNGTRFRDYRTVGEPLEKMKDRHPNGNYKDHEVTRPDKFKDDYCGKDYSDPCASEITSMGLQYLFDDPVAFLRDDPEYFEFMIHQLRGVRWMAPAEYAKAVQP